ncbi:MAG: DedA family protein [Dehalococcoidia bacterium]
MTALVAQYGVLIVAAIIFFGELGFPTLVPGEIALAIAGSQIVHSMHGLIVAAIGFAAVDIVATSTIHVVSRTGGHYLLVRLLRHLLSGSRDHEEMVRRWRARLGGRDSAVVFVTRMIPMFRLYASITTGLVRIRIRLRHILTGAAPASLLWASIPLSAGYLFRGSIHGLEAHYATVMQDVIVVSVGAILAGGATVILRGKALSSRGVEYPSA